MAKRKNTQREEFNKERKKQLLSMREEIKNSITNYGNGREIGDRVDRAVASSFDEEAAKISQHLAPIDHALRKIEDETYGLIGDGTYGICDDCGKEIPKARLRAIPYANLCVDCKARSETNPTEYPSKPPIHPIHTIKDESDLERRARDEIHNA